MKGNSLKQEECCRKMALESETKPSGNPVVYTQGHKASHINSLLRSQRGFTLLEAMVVTVVLAAMIATIYTGVVYADKQTRLNYRHRVATFIASGEIERQYTMYLKTNLMRPFTGKEVIIDDTSNTIVRGKLSVGVNRNTEFHLTQQYGFAYVTAEVSWMDPGTQKLNKVLIREDFYDVDGKVNP
jgi:prepilin-type N-terminal cleavage/methylation domain-containing protein